MTVLESRVDLSSAEFAANREHNLALVAELRARLAQVKQGGGQEAVRRHRARGKLLARERIERPTGCTPTRRRRLAFSPVWAK